MQALLIGSIGVLTETSELQRQAYNQAFLAHGLNHYWNVATYCSALVEPGGLRRLSKHFPALEPELLAWVHHDKQRYFDDLARKGLTLRPGVKSILGRCKDRGIKIGFATTAAPEIIQSLIINLEDQLDFGVFDIMTSKTDVVNEKPSPDVYYVVMEQMGVTPNNGIIIEDSYANYQAATTSGAQAVFFPGEYAQVPDGVAVVTDLSQVDVDDV